MKISELFRDVHYVGRAQGDRNTYHVFRGAKGYLVIAPTSTRGFYLNVVNPEVPDFISKRFHKKRLTAADLKRNSRRRDLFGKPFQPLQALYVMTALGRAQKLKERQGRALLFKIR